MESHWVKYEECSIVMTSFLAFGTTTYTFPSSENISLKDSKNELTKLAAKLKYLTAVKNGETEPRFILSADHIKIIFTCDNPSAEVLSSEYASQVEIPSRNKLKEKTLKES